MATSEKEQSANVTNSTRESQLLFPGSKIFFDVAHADALTKTSVLQEDKDFLLAQREKGRRGSMAGLDKKLAAKEKRAFEREEQMLARRHQMEQIKQSTASTAEPHLILKPA